MTERNLPTIAEIEKMDLVNLQLLDVDVLEALQIDLAERAKALTHEKKILEAVISDLLENYAESSFRAEEKDTGTVTFLRDTREIKATREKSVSWDQHFLRALWTRIESAGDDPAVYIKKSEPSYTVSETAYKDWPEDIKGAFEGGRSVKPGPTKFTFKPKES